MTRQYYFVTFCVLTFLFAARATTLLGGWKPVKDLKDKRVLEVAEYAVIEYNNKERPESPLILDSVDKGEYQVVAGLNYKLTLTVETTRIDGGRRPKHYEAVVYDGLNSRELVSFRPILR
ncbi:Cysteine proteinase inhibitor 5 [Linum perenne]